jgi:hypothetical protein
MYKSNSPNLEAFNNLMREIASRELQLMDFFTQAEKTLELQSE